MKKSNIKNMTSLEGSNTIAKYLGVSQATISAWRKRGYANLKFINQLAEYPDSVYTKDDFLSDFRNGVDE